MVELKLRRASITVHGRQIEALSDSDKELMNIIPTISLGSVVRQDGQDPILVEQIRYEVEETPYEKWYRERENIGQE